MRGNFYLRKVGKTCLATNFSFRSLKKSLLVRVAGVHLRKISKTEKDNFLRNQGDFYDALDAGPQKVP